MIKTLKQKLDNFIINHPMLIAILLAIGWILWGIYG